MIANVILNRAKEKNPFTEYVDYLIEYETLNFLKMNELIDSNIYEKANLKFKNLHIGN